MFSPLRPSDTPIQTAAPFGFTGPCLRHARDEEVFGEGEAAEHVYQVISGAVRTLRTLRDGRRQIDEFHFAGDYFGIEAGDLHRVSAEAMTDTTVRMVRRAALSQLAAKQVDVARILFRLTVEGLQRSQDHVLMLGRKTARERVVGLLIDLVERTGADGELDIPMTRQDMADYLGLTIETVSRTLTQLQADGIIAIPTTRHIVLRDGAALRRLAN
ncbi:helix-turn-helix domain-containing protein [Caulobacter henricii]|uniref:Transcriptional regulator n=1 Tax=Caulobacter henricii TaxID=69395 RepID=A0A0P0NXP7_9CAUL|nr:transcriptional regulator [Caulobacter henricii]